MSFHSADRIVADGVASGIAVGIGIGIGIALLLLPQIMKIISHFRLSLSKLDVACRFRRQQQRTGNRVSLMDFADVALICQRP